MSGQDNCGEIKDTLKLVGPYKQNEKVPFQLKLSLGINKYDRPYIGTGDPAGLFSEDYDLRHPRAIQGNFKKEFGMPVYDEYEEEYFQNIPDDPAVEINPADEKIQDAIRDQKVEAGKDDKGIGGDSLALCYTSFELIRHMIKASKQKQNL